MTTFEIPIRVTVQSHFAGVSDFNECKVIAEVIRSKVRRTLDSAAVVKSWSIDLPNKVSDRADDSLKENFK